MEEFKFTPGPWHVSNENALRIRDDQSFLTVATAGYVTNEEELATAYLIAAAPELLESLRECMEHMIWMSDEAKQCYARAEAVIAKALGK
ncbi:hypothetical protein [Klebsiella variicola]|uniref:hypothetical protein n=1 Tax=Klebsiella variicola TaxID=244366 RepID=UPI00101CD8C1|nr:hypothetical protein [Klebsiella variicola]